MEEKERYLWYNHSTEEIYDNEEDIVFVGAITVLNQQNRRILELIEENKQLKEQLSKKEETHKHIMSGEYIPVNIAEKSLKLSEQAQKQLAIEKLKLVLNNFKDRPAYFDVVRQELCLSDQDKQFIDFINNQIKLLKGEE